MLWSRHVLYILTCKCAFRHSGVQFFDIWRDKSAPKPSCFVHFDLQTCFSPQRRAIFQHLNFQKWSRIVSFLTFLLPNVLFATAACNFSTCQLPKVVRDCGVLLILTCECAFRHSGVQFLMSPLSTYLRTRRFNRPTFGLTRHANLWKNTAFRDFSNIWRGRIFFLTFWLLILLSTDLTTRLLLFNSPYCRKFLFKLPSIICSRSEILWYRMSNDAIHRAQSNCLGQLRDLNVFNIQIVKSFLARWIELSPTPWLPPALCDILCRLRAR